MSLVGNQLTTTKKDGEEQSVEVKHFVTFNAAVNFVHRKERVLES